MTENKPKNPQHKQQSAAIERHKDFQTFQQKINQQGVEKFNFIIQSKQGEDKNQRVFLQADQKFLPNIFLINNQGLRKYNEDRISILANDKMQIYSVMDGHGGEQCVNYIYTRFPFWMNAVLKKHINNHSKRLGEAEKAEIKRDIQCVFKMLKQRLLKKNIAESGCTLNSVIVFRDTLIVVNIGDSRAIGINKQFTFTQLSIDHKADEPFEKRMIEHKGGVVQGITSVPRINGLAMARAVGDLDNKHISEVPDVYFYNKSEYAYVLLASDGLWDVLSDEQVCNIMNRYFTQYLQGQKNIAKVNPVQYMFNCIQSQVEDNTSILMAIL